MKLQISAATRGNIGGGNLIKAVNAALKETMKAAKKDSAENLKKRYLKAGTFTKALRMRTSGLTGILSSRGAVQSIKHFKINPRRNVRKLPSGFFAQAVKSQGGYIPNTFIGDNSKLNGHLYRRTNGNKSKPIEKIVTVSQPGGFRKVTEMQDITSKIEKNFGGALAKYFTI